MDVILAGIETMPVKENIKLMCEPGRALVAEAESLIVRVDARRGNNLFINDGSYGMLFDAAHLGFIFPTRIVSRDIDPSEPLVPFELWGPTCDSIDYMKGPSCCPARSPRATTSRSATWAPTPAPSPAASTAMASTTRSSCSIRPC